MEEKIITIHPDPNKSGVKIHKDKYVLIRDGILKTLRSIGEVLFKDLPGEVERQLRGKFDGSISWYVTTEKLDLEARKLIERISGTSPQQLRLSDM